MRSIDWTVRAQDDLAEIDNYWWAIDHELAESLMTQIEAAADILAERPQVGRVVATSVRKWGVRGTPYLLIYRYETRRIEILRVHASQNWAAG